MEKEGDERRGEEDKIWDEMRGERRGEKREEQEIIY